VTIKYKTIKEIKNMISQKEISNKEIIKEVFDQIQKNEHLNAFITLNKEPALKKSEDLDNNPQIYLLQEFQLLKKIFFVQKV